MLFVNGLFVLLVQLLHFLDILLKRVQSVVHQLLLELVVIINDLFDLRAFHKLLLTQSILAWLLISLLFNLILAIQLFFDVHLLLYGYVALCLGEAVGVTVRFVRPVALSVVLFGFLVFLLGLLLFMIL